MLIELFGGIDLYNDLDVVFLGGLYPKHMYKKIYDRSLSGMQNAANNLQWNIVEGLDAISKNPVSILNLMFVGSYPKRYKDILIKSFSFSHCSGAKDYNIGYFNVTGIKQILLNSASKRHLKRWVNEVDNRSKVLIIYSAQSYFLEAAAYVKKLNKKVKICLIVPDLPVYMCLDAKNNMLLNIYKHYQVNKVNGKIESIDGFVFLTERMVDYFQTTKPYVVVEGMISNSPTNQSLNQKNIDNDFKTIVYTGTLTRKYGIMDLVWAFQKIKNRNYKLIICGDGEAKEEIIMHTTYDSRILYKGLLPYEEVKILQSQATILVNPRKNNEVYTKFSFPSKLMEYLISGRPVVCYKLDGIPDEYDDHLIYFENNSIETMVNTLENVCEMSDKELSYIGQKNREFVLLEKNFITQTQKIFNLILNLQSN